MKTDQLCMLFAMIFAATTFLIEDQARYIFCLLMVAFWATMAVISKGVQWYILRRFEKSIQEEIRETPFLPELDWDRERRRPRRRY